MIAAMLRGAADHLLVAQIRLGSILEGRRMESEVKVGQLDGVHVPHQVPWKFAPSWFGPYKVLEVKWAVCRLDLPLCARRLILSTNAV